MYSSCCRCTDITKEPITKAPVYFIRSAEVPPALAFLVSNHLCNFLKPVFPSTTHPDWLAVRIGGQIQIGFELGSLAVFFQHYACLLVECLQCFDIRDPGHLTGQSNNTNVKADWQGSGVGGNCTHAQYETIII